MKAENTRSHMLSRNMGFRAEEVVIILVPTKAWKSFRQVLLHSIRALMVASLLAARSSGPWDIWHTPVNASRKERALAHREFDERGIPLLTASQATEPRFGHTFDEAAILCNGQTTWQSQDDTIFTAYLQKLATTTCWSGYLLNWRCQLSRKTVASC